MIKNAIKHTKLVLTHKWYVFIYCTKLGLPWRGLVHDMSKFSPTEFCESVKYYDGKISPITVCKGKNGYSEAWLHHKGRNKHHTHYWVDETAIEKTPIIPYKYVAEMICDKLSASKVYNGKDWTKRSELEYWEKEKLRIRVNKHVEEMLTEVFEQVAEKGIEPVLTKSNIQDLYKKHCGDIKKRKAKKNEN